MGIIRTAIDDTTRRFIEAQHIFLVATAPLDAGGHLNISPKGLDSFRILSPTRVAYLDFNGSGVETIAHLKENGRIVLMFCAFEGPPNIFRLHGHGRAIEQHEPEFPRLAQNFPPYEHPRSIIVVELDRISDSCGYGVPLFEYKDERQQLELWARKRGVEGLKAYRQQKNRRSIDGLPGVSEFDHQGIL
jgi:hypothetical protein